MSMLDHVLIPIASEDDATVTCAALAPYLDDVERVTAVHVIEKAGGAIDKAPIGKRREDAAEYLAIVETSLGDEVAVDTRTAFGTDVVETIFDQAVDAGATAIAFCPRGGGRIVRLLTGDTATRLVTDPDLPVVSLPNPEREGET
jgi:nucleotide-binding universal stress UspA family protein